MIAVRALRRSRHDERGVAAVEFALLLPLLLLILFGIIEGSLVFRDSQTIVSATRAAARSASALPRDASFADVAASAAARAVDPLPDSAIEELLVYKADTNGMPLGGSFGACSTSCVHYTWNGTTFTSSGGSWPAASQSCDGSDAVGVYLKVDHQFLTAFFPSNMTLTDHTVMNLEPTSCS